MQRKNRHGDSARRGTFCFFLALLAAMPILIALWPDDGHAQSYWSRHLSLARRYTLYGSVELFYMKEWVKDAPSTTTFTQNYELGLRGFVVDPRIVNFDIAGTYTDTNVSGQGGQGYTLKGARLFVTILEKLPPRLLTSWKYIPNPIFLRYNHYTGPQDYTHYGITLRHSMPAEVVAIRRQQDPGAAIIFPTTFLDYDRYEYKSGGETTKSDLYTLRSFIAGKTFDYRLILQSEDLQGPGGYERRVAELQPNHRFFDPKTGRLLDFTNLVRYDDFVGDRRSFVIRSRQNYLRPFGKDSLQVVGQTGYNNFSAADSHVDAYDQTVSVGYTKVYSPVFTNVYTAIVGYNSVDAESAYFARLIDSFTYDISRYLRTQGSVFAGPNQNGLEYGLNAYISTKTTVFARLGYELASLKADIGDTFAQKFTLESSGPIAGTLSFSTNLQYTILDQQEGRQEARGLSTPIAGGAFRDNVFTAYTQAYTANLYWFILRTSFAIGGTYTVVETEFPDRTEKDDYTALFASITRPITKRSFVNVYSTWTRDAFGTETIEIRPRLSWSRRFTSIDVEYDYRKTTSRDSGETERDDRLFVRFVRLFSRDFFFR